MPITQDRIAVLIEEATGIARSAEALRAICQEGIKLGGNEGLALIQSHLTVNPLPSPVHLLLELRHQQVFAKRNLRKREKAAAKRREAGIPEAKNLAPTLLSELGLGTKEDITSAFEKWNRGE